MRTFSSYGPVDKDLHFYVPREDLVRRARELLIGKDPEKGGHYITVWGPRQTGKTWIMNEVVSQMDEKHPICALKLSLEPFKMTSDVDRILQKLSEEICRRSGLKTVTVRSIDEFDGLFKKGVLKRPLVLLLDEFDALPENAINAIVTIFRHIYIRRLEDDRPTAEKEYLLHGVALIGVRGVLGIENVTGSPFNVQRSLHIPNLSLSEVSAMFEWYGKESGRVIEPEVIQRIYGETRGQPGLVSWFGELLTEGYEGYRPNGQEPLTPEDFNVVLPDALDVLPNNTILNMVSKARQEPYKSLVLELFRTRTRPYFKFDDPRISFLYMNGIVEREKQNGQNYLRFSCPFVQKRLFGYFSRELFPHLGTLFEPFEDVRHILTDTDLDVKALIRRYEQHLQKNRGWMLANAPRRSDGRIYEAVFHFNLYEFLIRFFDSYPTKIWPEFPTGNGKVDILIDHGGTLHALEIKSYKDQPAFRQALTQAAGYGASLKMDRIHLVVFVDGITDAHRETYEVDVTDQAAQVTVSPVFVDTGGA
jgi:hypothetical protein